MTRDNYMQHLVILVCFAYLRRKQMMQVVCVCVSM